MVASGRTGRFGLLRVSCSQPVNRLFFFFLLLRPVFFLISFSFCCCSSSSATASRPPPSPSPSSPLAATASTSFHDLLRVLVFAAFLTPAAYFNARGGDALCASFTKVTATARLCWRINAGNTAPPSRRFLSSLFPLVSFCCLFFISARGYRGDNVVFRRFPCRQIIAVFSPLRSRLVISRELQSARSRELCVQTPGRSLSMQVSLLRIRRRL